MTDLNPVGKAGSAPQGVANGNNVGASGNNRPAIGIVVVKDNQYHITNIRNYPDFKGAVVAKTVPGAKLSYLSKSNNGFWYEVVYPNCKKPGWIFNKLVKEQPIVAQPKPEAPVAPAAPLAPAAPSAAADKKSQPATDVKPSSAETPAPIGTGPAVKGNPPATRSDAEVFFDTFKAHDKYLQFITKKDKERKIDRTEAKTMGISDALFDLIDSGMVVGGKGDGYITVEEISQFDHDVDKYAKVICDGDRGKAVEQYNAAKGFEWRDLNAVESSSDVVGSALGIVKGISGTQLFGILGGLTPPLNTIMAAYCRSTLRVKEDNTVVTDDLVKRINLRLASLSLVAQLDDAFQDKVLGAHGLPKFNLPITPENIFNYVLGRKPAEGAGDKAGTKPAGTSDPAANLTAAEGKMKYLDEHKADMDNARNKLQDYCNHDPNTGAWILKDNMINNPIAVKAKEDAEQTFNQFRTLCDEAISLYASVTDDTKATPEQKAKASLGKAKLLIGVDRADDAKKLLLSVYDEGKYTGLTDNKDKAELEILLAGLEPYRSKAQEEHLDKAKKFDPSKFKPGQAPAASAQPKGAPKGTKIPKTREQLEAETKAKFLAAKKQLSGG